MRGCCFSDGSKVREFATEVTEGRSLFADHDGIKSEASEPTGHHASVDHIAPHK
jgi:hypothetical protein